MTAPPWYDLHALTARPHLVDRAMADRETLRLVLRVKHAHYGGKGVKYQDCGAGRLRLATSGGLRSQLERDYDEMASANMFVAPPPRFEAIATGLAEIEAHINAHLKKHPVTIEEPVWLRLRLNSESVLRLHDDGQDYFPTVFEMLQRALAGRREGFARSAGDLLVSRLKRWRAWEFLCAMPPRRASASPETAREQPCGDWSPSRPARIRVA